jgi:CheY-like chemotaxis protein
VPKTVLIADDNERIRKLLCRIFESEPDYVLCAEAVSGEEAILLARQHKPDLIVLDLAMSGMNGIDTARKLKVFLPNVPIILFTQHADVLPYFKHISVDCVVSKTDVASLMKHVRALVPA